MIRKLRLLGLAVIGCLMSMGVDVSDTDSVTVPENIWLNDTLLLVADRDNGLMVFSVADASAARHIINIQVNRNSGVAASGTTIFANSNDSIVAYRLGADNQVKRLGGIKLYSYYPEYYYEDDYHPFFVCAPVMADAAQHLSAPLLPFLSCSGASSSDGGTEAANTGGSMSVFAVIDTFLYYVDESNLYTVSISNPSHMRQLSEQTVSWGDVETIFPTSRYLFIGGRNGMYMYDRSDGRAPVYAGMVAHIRSCDPVVVRGAVAFVTLRSGNTCGAAQDILMAVDISDPSDARILREISVATPYGLAAGDSLLYVANGWSGFSLYRAANPNSLEQIARWDEPATRDFIWNGDRLYLMGMEEIGIYDVADPSNPVRLGGVE